MREELIEKEILKVLATRGCGAKLSTLKSEVAIRVDNPLMGAKDFADTLERLHVRGAVSKDTTALGSEIYSISSLGRQMLKEEGWI